MVFGRGLGITAAGLGLGLLLAVGAARLFAGLLVGVGSLDPVTYGTATVLLAAVALAASLAPALRAVRTDPVAVLRQD